MGLRTLQAWHPRPRLFAAGAARLTPEGERTIASNPTAALPKRPVDSGNEPAGLPLGDLLVREGLVGKQDVERALAIQAKERKFQELPLGRILVKIGALDDFQVQDLLKSPELRSTIGSLAVEKKLISQDQLSACLWKKKPDELIGQFLVRQGFLTQVELRNLLNEQVNASRFGELAVKQKLISREDLEHALRLQRAPRKLGEILCDLDLLRPLDLQNVLKKYNKQLELGDLLVALGYLKKDQLHKARQENAGGPEDLHQILLRKQLVAPEQLQKALSKQYNIPFNRLDNFVYYDSDKQLLSRIISQKYAEKNLILPIALSGKRLTLALLRPQWMVRIVNDLQEMYSQYDISCVLITEEKYEELFELLYSRHLRGKPRQGESPEAGGLDIDIMELNIEEGIRDQNTGRRTAANRDLEAEELVNFVLKYGIVNGASDIHLEQDRKRARLRYRFDGILREPRNGWLQDKLQEKALAMIARIKAMANLDIAEKRLPQDGGFRLQYHDKADGERVGLDFRVATCRSNAGENVTIRIIDPRQAKRAFEQLNHAPHVMIPLKSMLKSPGGMVLVCGPTGSGKTSTLYAALHHIHTPSLKIITAEDPIEYNFPGIMQTAVNPKIDLTFARLLRSFLRFDPDVILVGEIRDEETARLAFDAAQSGHLLLSTLHTNDAVSAVQRLLDLNVEYGQIASSLMGVVAQRLVRKTCPSCTQETLPEEGEWNVLFKQYPAHLRFYRGEGCPACNFSGYRGRTLISEIFVVDGEIAHALKHGYEAEHLQKLAVESGMKTLIDDGLAKLPLTTLSEILRIMPHDMIKGFRARQVAQGEIDRLMDTPVDPASGRNSGAGFREFYISNPESQRSKVDLIQAAYDDLLSRSEGFETGPVDPHLFKMFISENVHRIRNAHGCAGVAFSVGRNPTTGKAAIWAAPHTQRGPIEGTP